MKIDAPCPVCGKRMRGSFEDWPEFPFCSPRCKTIDLGRWLNEDYGIPAEEIDDVADQDSKEE